MKIDFKPFIDKHQNDVNSFGKKLIITKSEIKGHYSGWLVSSSLKETIEKNFKKINFGFNNSIVILNDGSIISNSPNSKGLIYTYEEVLNFSLKEKGFISKGEIIDSDSNVVGTVIGNDPKNGYEIFKKFQEYIKETPIEYKTKEKPKKEKVEKKVEIKNPKKLEHKNNVQEPNRRWSFENETYLKVCEIINNKLKWYYIDDFEDEKFKGFKGDSSTEIWMIKFYFELHKIGILKTMLGGEVEPEEFYDISTNKKICELLKIPYKDSFDKRGLLKNKPKEESIINQKDIVFEHVFKDKYHKNGQDFEIESFNLIFTKDKIILLMNDKYHKDSMFYLNPGGISYYTEKTRNEKRNFLLNNLLDSKPDKKIFELNYPLKNSLSKILSKLNNEFKDEIYNDESITKSKGFRESYFFSIHKEKLLKRPIEKLLLNKCNEENKSRGDLWIEESLRKRFYQLYDLYNSEEKLSNMFSFTEFNLDGSNDDETLVPNFCFDYRYNNIISENYIHEGSLFCNQNLTVLEPLNIPFRGSLTETEKKGVINQIKLVLRGEGEKLLNLNSNLNSLKKELIEYKNDKEKFILNNNLYFNILKNNQSKIIEIDREYVQKFIKLNNYLKEKSSNLNIILDKIISNIENKSKESIIERLDEINFFKGLVYSYNLMVNHSIVMVTSLVEDDMITFYETYEVFDKMNVFNTNWENEVNDKLSEINESLQDLNFSIRGLMNQMRGMERNIVNGLQSINTSIGSLENSVNKQLSETNSRLKYENLTNYYKKSTLPGVMDWFDGL